MPKLTAFEKLELESAKNTIIDNLKNLHQSKLVNFGCATRGLDFNNATSQALSQLIVANWITIREYPLPDKHGSTHYAMMYRYNTFHR